MLTVICNIQNHPSNKGKSFLEIIECQPCAIINYKLTTSSDPFNKDAIPSVLESIKYDRFNSIHYNYKQETLADFRDFPSYIKYMAIFEDNNLLKKIIFTQINIMCIYYMNL